MTPKELLIEARKVIEKPEHWTQGALARDAAGRPLRPSEAVCFCSMGAVLRAGRTSATTDVLYLAGKALRDAAGTSFVQFNDNHTHAEVLAMFDKAIESL